MAAAQSPGRGLRRFDEHAAKATKLVDEFCGLETGMAPSNALAALKRAAPYIGVPLRVVSVIDLLFAWTKPQDWLGGQIPVVWPSNDLLAQKLGVTVRQVQKLLNQAQAFGLVSFRDSPNGHRGGRRGADGFITWGYGIVLAPIGTRLQEFAARAAKGAAEDAALTVLRKRLAAARRNIRALAQTAFDADLHDLKAGDDLALALMATDQMRCVRDAGLLTGCVEQIEERARRLAGAVSAKIAVLDTGSDQNDSSCWDGLEDIHSTTTNQLQSAKADTRSGLAKDSSGNGDALLSTSDCRRRRSGETRCRSGIHDVDRAGALFRSAPPRWIVGRGGRHRGAACGPVGDQQSRVQGSLSHHGPARCCCLRHRHHSKVPAR